MAITGDNDSYIWSVSDSNTDGCNTDDDFYLNALIRVYLIAAGFLIFTGFAGLAVLYLVL